MTWMLIAIAAFGAGFLLGRRRHENISTALIDRQRNERERTNRPPTFG